MLRHRQRLVLACAAVCTLYPGYGNRPGRATEAGLKAAALAGFEAESGRYRSVYLCGQSLGAGVTEPIFVKHAGQIAKLILVTPFLSLAEMARAQFAWLPTGWILRDRMELFDQWLGFPGESVVVIAARDEIIPREHSVRYAAARSEKREIIEMPVTHNTIELDAGFWQKVLTRERSAASPLGNFAAAEGERAR